MTRLLIIGGAGYYGGLVAGLLRAMEGVDVVVAGRFMASDGGAARLDLNDPDTFSVMEGFDAILNCADTVGAPPDPAMRYALDRGLTWFEMGADLPTLERLLTLDPGVGAAILGVGIFPGVSTSLAHSLRGESPLGAVELGVRVSPLSGAGRANCGLMTQTLVTPSIRFEDHRRVQGPPVGPSSPMPFLGSGICAAAEIPLPDAVLIHHQGTAPTVTARMALKPGFMVWNFKILAALIGRLGPLKAAALTLTRWSLILARAALLRGVQSTIQITAIADRGTPRERTRQLSIKEGQLSTALGTAAALSLWLKGPRPAPGLHVAGQLFDFDALVAEMKTLGGPDLHLDTSP